MPEWALGLEVGNEGHETVSKYGTCSSRTPGGTSPLRQVFHTSSRVPNVPLEDMFAVLSDGEEEVRDL